MSADDETGNVRVVADTGEAEAKLDAIAEAVAELDGKTAAERADVHVISLRGADGFDLLHLAGGCPADCPVGEAAGRISLAFCATLGTWACDVDAGGLVLVERLGD